MSHHEALLHLGGRLAEWGTCGPSTWEVLRSLGPAFVVNPDALRSLDPPDGTRDQWSRDLRATRGMNLLLLAELNDVRENFDAAGLKVIALKGAAALECLYADPGLRPMDDVDLLVRRQDRLHAVAILERRGYRAVPLDAGRLGPVGRTLHAAQAFRRRVGEFEVEVDLHWHPISDARLRAAFPCAFDGDLWVRDPVEDLLVTCAAQLLGHPWTHPLGYLDSRLLVEGFGAEQWLDLRRRAFARRLSAVVYWSLRFTRELFGLPPSADEALAALAPGPVQKRLGDRLIGADWLGLASFRREMAARDLFVLLLAGAAGAWRMARSGLAEREVDGTRRVATIDPRSSAQAALWLAQTALQAAVARPARG